MDYSVARRIPTSFNRAQRVSTQEIKNGLERIRKAQEQVLEQLRRNHEDEQDQLFGHIQMQKDEAQIVRRRTMENQKLQRQLSVQKQRSNQKSTLYRRRVIDLQSSLALHTQNQDKLMREIQNKERRIDMLNQKVRELQKIINDRYEELQSTRKFRQKYKNLEISYNRLLEQSQKSAKNVRKLQQQVVNLNKKMQQSQTLQLKTNLQRIMVERDALMSQKVQLLKKGSQTESEYLRLKQKYALMEKQMQERQFKGNNFERIADILIDQLNLMNQTHQMLFQNYRKSIGGSRIPRALMDNQDKYQQSLNRITQILQKMQQNSQFSGIVSKLQNAVMEQKIAQKIKSKQDQYARLLKAQSLKLKAEKESFRQKQVKYQNQMEELQKQNKNLTQKLQKMKEDKKSYLDEIQKLTKTLHKLKIQADENLRKRSESEAFRQQNKQSEYQAMLNELGQQMQTIKKQKRDLDGLLSKIAAGNPNNTHEDDRNRRKINEILGINEKIKAQNERIKQKYESTVIQKQSLYLQSNEYQRQNEDLMKKLTIQVLQRQKMTNMANSLQREISRFDNQRQQFRTEIERLKLAIKGEKQAQGQMNMRIHQQTQKLRRQIQATMFERQQLKELKVQFQMLKKQHTFVSKRSRQANDKIDHLWSIKEVQYQNIVGILQNMNP